MLLFYTANFMNDSATKDRAIHDRQQFHRVTLQSQRQQQQKLDNVKFNESEVGSSQQNLGSVFNNSQLYKQTPQSQNQKYKLQNEAIRSQQALSQQQKLHKTPIKQNKGTAQNLQPQVKTPNFSSYGNIQQNLLKYQQYDDLQEKYICDNKDSSIKGRLKKKSKSLPEVSQIKFGKQDEYTQRYQPFLEPQFKSLIYSQWYGHSKPKKVKVGQLQHNQQQHTNQEVQPDLNSSQSFNTREEPKKHLHHSNFAKQILRSHSCENLNSLTFKQNKDDQQHQQQYKNSRSMELPQQIPVQNNLVNLASFNCYNSLLGGQLLLRFQESNINAKSGLFGVAGYGHHLLIQKVNIQMGETAECLISQPQQIYVSSRTTSLNWRPQAIDQCSIGDSDGCFRIVNVETLEFLVDIECHSRKIISICESEFYKQLFMTIGSEGTAKLWQGHPQDNLLTIRAGYHNYFHDAQFSKDDPNILAISAMSGRIYLYDLRNAVQPYQVLQSNNTSTVKKIKFMKQNKIISSSLDQSITSWKMLQHSLYSNQPNQITDKYEAQFYQQQKYFGHQSTENVYDMDVMYGRDLISTGSASNKVYIYNAQSERPLACCKFYQQNTGIVQSKVDDSVKPSYLQSRISPMRHSDIEDSYITSVQFLPETYNLIDPVVFALNSKGWLNLYQLKSQKHSVQ